MSPPVPAFDQPAPTRVAVLDSPDRRVTVELSFFEQCAGEPKVRVRAFRPGAASATFHLDSAAVVKFSLDSRWLVMHDRAAIVLWSTCSPGVKHFRSPRSQARGWFGWSRRCVIQSVTEVEGVLMVRYDEPAHDGRSVQVLPLNGSAGWLAGPGPTPCALGSTDSLT